MDVGKSVLEVLPDTVSSPVNAPQDIPLGGGKATGASGSQRYAPEPVRVGKVEPSLRQARSDEVRYAQFAPVSFRR